MKILVIRYSSMGDVMLITPLLRMLKLQLDASIDVITKKHYVSLLKHNPYITRIHTKEDTSIDKLKSESYDHIIDLQKNLRSILLRNIIGAKSSSYRKLTVKKWLYLLFRINKLDQSHVVHRYIEAAYDMGVKDDGEGMDLILKSEEKYPLKLQSPNKKLVVIVMGGSYVTKRIPPELCAILTLDQKYNYVLLGGSDCTVDIQPLYGVSNLIGKTSLKESSSIVARADIVVSGDTGLMHIAAALQKPLVVIWGSTSSDFGFAPYYGSRSKIKSVFIENTNLNCRPCSKYGRKSCPKGHMNCLKALDASLVKLEIDKLLC